MKVKIAKWGNSLAVRLPKAVADELGLRLGSEVDVTVEDGDVCIRPRTPIPRYRLEDLLAQIKPGTKPPPLEDWSAVEVPWPDDDWSDVAPTDEEMGITDARAKRKRSGRR